MQYLREARFLQQGFDGLMQLSNVYKATIEMFGNTLFYPGNDLFINPYGIGGTALGSPTQGNSGGGTRSIANILGLGGYHTIISIKSTIRPGDYSTTIEAQQYYTGDKSGNPNLNGKNMYNKLLQDQNKIENSNSTDFGECNDLLNENFGESIRTDDKEEKDDVEKGGGSKPVKIEKEDKKDKDGGKKDRTSSGGGSGGGPAFISISDTSSSLEGYYKTAFRTEYGNVIDWVFDEALGS